MTSLKYPPHYQKIMNLTDIVYLPKILAGKRLSSSAMRDAQPEDFPEAGMNYNEIVRLNTGEYLSIEEIFKMDPEVGVTTNLFDEKGRLKERRVVARELDGFSVTTYSPPGRWTGKTKYLLQR